VFIVFLALTFIVSGCERWNDLSGNDGENTPDTPSEPGYTPTGVPVARDKPGIKEKFGVTLTGTEGVNAAFLELSAYIKTAEFSSDANVIRLGDWIDLEGGLTVDAYGAGENTGGFTASNEDIIIDEVEEDWYYVPGYEGKLLRLIVVGINSFQSGRGVKKEDIIKPTKNGETDGRYAETVNDGTPHVVFHFQNIPVSRRMNATDTNEGGYRDSEMRQYLISDTDSGGSGRISFLAGLKNAGVPDEVLWGPTRIVSVKGKDGSKEISDLLWLPTVNELCSIGGGKEVVEDETTKNQARLEYHLSIDDVKKYVISGAHFYWLASPYAGSSSSFCFVNYSGDANFTSAGSSGGCVPAFCVR
jgi:hypothetical protein